jgi:DNA repair protein RecN (Recombination protein N)
VLALHGQSAQHGLLRPVEQRAALDRYAGGTVTRLLAEWTVAYDRWRDASAALAELTARRRERAQEADLLRLGLVEIAAAQPTAGEDEELAREVRRLAHAESLRGAAAAAHDVLLSDDDGPADATTLVGQARRSLAAAGGHDADLDALAERLSEVSYLLADVAADLGAYASHVEIDPLRLEAAQSRQATLAGLVRKYADSLSGVLDWARAAEVRLAELDGDDDRTAGLVTEEAELRRRLAQLAADLSAARAVAGAAFAAAVTAELPALAMPAARVDVVVTSAPPDDPSGWGPTGVDQVELTLAAHPGAPARPLARAASGGELSRVMLAVEVVFAGADPVPVMVFDEVDAGVGGQAAVEVGRRLALLARDHQVLVVTHLPQVAAFADAHLRVAKDVSGMVTASGVERLDGESRLRELSRMLAGLEDSDLARGHAQELLEAAAAAKNS